MGQFTVKKKFQLTDLEIGSTVEESDLLLQDGNSVYQFKHSAEDSKTLIEPGTFCFTERMGDIEIKPFNLQNRNILESALSSQSIIDEANAFFNNLDIYDQLGEPKVRKLLLHSIPGCGKSSTIVKFITNLMEVDPGTTAIIWPTNNVEAYMICRLLNNGVSYSPKCTKLVIVAEDIGGDEKDVSYGRDKVDSDLLEFLDGVGVSFAVPTLIIATTNHPENIASALIDRPGRFDMVLEIKPPSGQERVEIIEFIAKRKMNDEEKEAVLSSMCDDMSVAYLKEAVVRSLINKRTLVSCLKELYEHKKKFKKSFEKEEDEIGF